MTTAAGFMGLFFYYFLSVFFAAIFGTKFFTVCLRVFPALLQFHFACRTLFLEKVEHVFIYESLTRCSRLTFAFQLPAIYCAYPGGNSNNREDNCIIKEM